MDLYLLLLPLLLLLALTKLVFMKYAFAESIALSCFKKKPSKIIETEANASEVPAQMPSSDPKDVSSSESFCLAFKPTLLYFVQNMTLIELCMTRRPKNKISSLLAVSIIATLCILAQSPVYYCFLGAIISFLYFSVYLILASHNDPYSKESYDKRIFLVLSTTVFGLILDIVLASLLFKNYHNTQLAQFAINCIVNVSLDAFIVKPITCILLSLLFCRLSSVNWFIALEARESLNLLEKIEDSYKKLGKASDYYSGMPKMSRQGFYGPIPLTQGSANNQYAHKIAMDILKRIKKDKMLPPLVTPNKPVADLECSLNSLFSSSKKDRYSPMAAITLDLYRANLEEEPRSARLRGKRRRYPTSYNLILVTDNAQDIPTKYDSGASKNGNPYSQIQIQYYYHSKRSSKKNYSNYSSYRDRSHTLGNVLKIEQNQDEYKVEQQQWRIKSSVDEYQSKANTFGMLEIKEVYRVDYIYEINLNSPTKRKRGNKEDPEEKTRRLKAKRMSTDSRRRVIKFSTGYPYLEYLPHMLAKYSIKTDKTDKHEKPSKQDRYPKHYRDDRNDLNTLNTKRSQQPLSRKDIIMDNRGINSVKRAKKRIPEYINDYNIPEFRIYDM